MLAGTRLLAARSRPAQHAQRRPEQQSALAQLRRIQHLLRLGLCQRIHRPSVSLFRRLPARAHHRQPRARQKLRREVHSRRQRPQRLQHPRAARQQPHLRRLPLQRSPADLCRASLSLSLLMCFHSRCARRPGGPLNPVFGLSGGGQAPEGSLFQTDPLPRGQRPSSGFFRSLWVFSVCFIVFHLTKK